MNVLQMEIPAHGDRQQGFFAAVVIAAAAERPVSVKDEHQMRCFECELVVSDREF